MSFLWVLFVDPLTPHSISRSAYVLGMSDSHSSSSSIISSFSMELGSYAVKTENVFCLSSGVAYEP